MFYCWDYNSEQNGYEFSPPRTYSQVEEIHKEQRMTDCCMGWEETKQDAVMEANVCARTHVCTRVCKIYFK